MIQALIRFVLGGALVALLPLVAERMGPAVAGIVLLYPAVSFAGLLFLGQAQGMSAVADTALSAVLGLPTVLAFLLAVSISARRGLSLPLTLTMGVTCWFAVALPIVISNRRRTNL